MRFDLSKSEQGEWFTYCDSSINNDGEVIFADPEPDAGRVCLRLADAEILDNIYSKTRTKSVEHILNPSSRQMERLAFVDQTPSQEKLEREMVWDFAIVALDGILDKDGNEIECTLSNKLALMNIPRFARFVGRCLKQLAGAEPTIAADRLKNL